MSKNKKRNNEDYFESLYVELEIPRKKPKNNNKDLYSEFEISYDVDHTVYQM